MVIFYSTVVFQRCHIFENILNFQKILIDQKLSARDKKSYFNSKANILMSEYIREQKLKLLEYFDVFIYHHYQTNKFLSQKVQ